MNEFNRPTLEDIHTRIKADLEGRLTGGAPLPRFSFLNILAIVIAGAVFLMYGFLDWTSKQLFSWSMGEATLEREMQAYGIPRHADTYATGEVQVWGQPGVTVPEGAVLTDSRGVRYATTAPVTTGWPYPTVGVQAVEPGSIGNTSDTELVWETPLAGLHVEAPLTVAIIDGADKESVEDARARLAFRLANPPASGTKTDWARWATEAPGCAKAWVWGATDTSPLTGLAVGSGQVLVLGAGPQLTPIANTTQIEAHLDTVKPADAQYTFASVTAAPVDYWLRIQPSTQAAKDAVSAALQATHLASGGPLTVFKISAVYAALASVGLDDFEIDHITYKGGPHATGDVTPTGTDVVSKGAVTYV